VAQTQSNQTQDLKKPEGSVIAHSQQVQLPPHLQEINIDVSQNKKVVIKISSPNWGEIKSTATSRVAFNYEVFTGLRVAPWNSKFFLNVKEWRGDKSVVPLGSIVIFRALTGSNKHIYHLYYATFIVKEDAKAEIELQDHGKSSDKKTLKLVVENLQPLPEPTSDDIKNAEAEILNRGLEISKFVDSKDVLLTLYHYYVRQKVASQSVAPATQKIVIEIVADKLVNEDVEKLVNELRKLGLNIKIYQAPCD
jgi:hypothetical protein